MAAARPVEQPPPARMRAVQRHAREQRRKRQPDELDFPALRPQRALTVGRERDRDDRPRRRRPRHQQDRGGERKAREEPTDPGEAHQSKRKLVARERGRAATPHSPRDLAAVDARKRGDRTPSRVPLGRGHRQGDASIRPEAGEHGQRRGYDREGFPRLERAHSRGIRRAGGDAIGLDSREGNAEHVVRAHARPDRDDDEPRPSQRQLGSGAAQRSEDEADQEHHQPAEHVELGVQVDDHVACVSAAVE